MRNDFGKDISFAFMSDDFEYAARGPLEIQKLEEGELMPILFKLDPGEAQKLIDDLWDCGLRPSEGAGSAGAMMAVQNHLKDTQKIVSVFMSIIQKREGI